MARRVAGNLSMLALALMVAVEQGRDVGELVRFKESPEFEAVNLWNPYQDEGGLLEAGPPRAGAPDGSYFFEVSLAWEGRRFLHAVTKDAVISVKVSISLPSLEDLPPGALEEGMGRVELPYPPIPQEEDPALAACRIIGKVAFHARPSLPIRGVAADPLPDATGLEDLKTNWRLWDPETFFSDSPILPENVSLHPGLTWPGPFTDCHTSEGSVWKRGTPLEKGVFSRLEELGLLGDPNP